MGAIKDDTEVLPFLHLTQCEPALNSNMIKSITEGFLVTFTWNSIIGVSLSESLEFEKVVRIKRAVNALAFPGKFPRANLEIKGGRDMISLEKQIRAGFIPTLCDYSFNATGLSLDLYTQMLRRIVAVAIQSTIRMIFKKNTNERGILGMALGRYMQRILPDCTIEPLPDFYLSKANGPGVLYAKWNSYHHWLCARMPGSTPRKTQSV